MLICGFVRLIFGGMLVACEGLWHVGLGQVYEIVDIVERGRVLKVEGVWINEK